MKLAVNKKQFLGSWSLAERSTSAGGTVSILSSILIKASAESVILQATDIKTSVICRAAGVTVLEPGEAVFPIKMVSDLFKKAPGEEFTLDVDGGKVVLKAGRSKYNFSTYPVSEFPPRSALVGRGRRFLFDTGGRACEGSRRRHARGLGGRGVPALSIVG